MKILKILGVILASVAGLILIAILACYCIVDHNASGRTFDNVEDVPAHEYGLLLGAPPKTPQGERNHSFDNRIKAAVELYKAGKIKQIIASGGCYLTDDSGNRRQNGYDEIRAMADSLMKNDIPFSAITLDYDGTRTLNSIVKAKEFYGIDSCIIISQPYHNKRAIYQADHYGLKTVGYNAENSPIQEKQLKNWVREVLARVKLFMDLYSEKKPEFDGMALKMPSGQFEDWKMSYSKLSSVPMATEYTSMALEGYGYYKGFMVKNNQPFYYNSRHGIYLLLPEGMGKYQYGENEMAAHSNEFYNDDNSLVVSFSAWYYDVLLIDSPHYADTLATNERKYLDELGKHTIKKLSPDEWLTEGVIDHSNKENPPADRFIRKWVLKKDAFDRECEMSIMIYYNDSLSYRLPELKKIIDLFPDKPDL